MYFTLLSNLRIKQRKNNIYYDRVEFHKYIQIHQNPNPNARSLHIQKLHKCYRNSNVGKVTRRGLIGDKSNC